MAIAGLSAAEVLREAEAEADRVEGEMYVIARQLWGKLFPKEALPADDVEGKRLTIRAVLGRVNQDHGRPEDLVKDARATAEHRNQQAFRQQLLDNTSATRSKGAANGQFLLASSGAR